MPQKPFLSRSFLAPRSIPLRSAPHCHTECGGMCPSLTLRTPAFLSTSVSHAVSRNRAAPPPPPTPFSPAWLGGYLWVRSHSAFSRHGPQRSGQSHKWLGVKSQGSKLFWIKRCCQSRFTCRTLRHIVNKLSTSGIRLEAISASF